MGTRQKKINRNRSFPANMAIRMEVCGPLYPPFRVKSHPRGPFYTNRHRARPSVHRSLSNAARLCVVCMSIHRLPEPP
ncbi:unnamed protein product [Ectocarpus sp. 8 AP-2014]